MGDLRRTGSDPFDDRGLHTLFDLADALAALAAGDPDPISAVVDPAESALEGVPSVTIAKSAAREVAHGAPVYAPGVLDVEPGAAEADLVACYTPDGAVVCLGRVVGDPDQERGTVVDLERVLV
jgi:tRNA pseudouridine55 synthase